MKKPNDEMTEDCAAERENETDEEYWERMLMISLGPARWNFGCG